MHFISNRRTFARGVAALAVAQGRGMMRPGLHGGRTVAAEDLAPLSVAMLDDHATRMEPIIEKYAEQVGGKIEVTPLAYGDLYTQLSLALTQRSAAFDVVSVDDPWIPQFASFLTPASFSEDLTRGLVPVAGAIARFPADAAPCGIPWLGDSQFFADRPNWLAQAEQLPPQTWDDTLDAAESIAATMESDDDVAAFAISTLTPHALVDSYLPILRGYGKDLIDPKTSVPQLDTPEAVESIDLFQRLADLSPIESAATGEPTNLERFESGVVAIMSNFWASARLAASSAEVARESGPIQCSLQPAQPGIDRQSMTGVWIAGVPFGSEQPERATAFVEWLVSLPTQSAMVEVSLPPVLAPVYADDALIDRQPDLPQLLDLLASGTPRPRSPYYPQLELLLATELASMLNGEQSGEEAIRNANIAMRAFLAREGVLVA